jgi:hypothetical protein
MDLYGGDPKPPDRKFFLFHLPQAAYSDLLQQGSSIRRQSESCLHKLALDVARQLAHQTQKFHPANLDLEP